MRIYKLSANWQEDRDHVFYHGTDSPAFDSFDSSKAVKGKSHYNPLGEAMYATDKEDFARMFGRNVYPVHLPAGSKLKRVSPSLASRIIRDIVIRALGKVGVRYWDTDLMFKVDLGRELDKAAYSPYDSIMEAATLVALTYPDKAEAYYEWVKRIASAKFAKYDAVIFVGTNDPNAIFEGTSPTKEVLIFNKAFQRVIS